jgi:hypothetical protein
MTSKTRAYFQPGYYKFTVVPRRGQTITYFNVVVTAKAAKDDQAPML